MTAIKKKKLRTMKMKISIDQPSHTIVSFILVAMAILIMAFFAIRHSIDESDWATSALMQGSFGLIGLLGTQLLSKQPVIPTQKEQFKKVNLDTGIRSILIAGAGMIIQLISQQVLSFTILEQAVYFIFSAITEEVFFRGFLLGIFIKLEKEFDKNPSMDPIPIKTIGVIVQAIAFVAIHQNYYGDVPMLIGLGLGGLMLGIVYIVWEDLTANILGHFIINIIAVQNLLVLL